MKKGLNRALEIIYEELVVAKATNSKDVSGIELIEKLIRKESRKVRINE